MSGFSGGGAPLDFGIAKTLAGLGAIMKAVLIAGLFVAIGATGAVAQSRCRVMDPTGTPLNIRSAPNGLVVGNLRNGVLVSASDGETDDKGRAWVFVSDYASGRPWGWVFREFIACF